MLLYALSLSPNNDSPFPGPRSSGDKAADLVTLLVNSLTIPEVISKDCTKCNDEPFHTLVIRLQRPAGHPDRRPELVVHFKRFDNYGRKVREKIILPSALFVVPGLDELYYLKYVAVHVGDDVQHGHYFSFERISPAQAAFDEKATAESDEVGTPFTPMEAFDNWTRYEDNQKDELQRLESIQDEYGRDTYLLRLTPASAQDIQSLVSIDELLAEVQTSLIEASRDHSGSMFEAITLFSPDASTLIMPHLKTLFAQIVQPSFTSDHDRGPDDQIWLQALSSALGRSQTLQIPLFMSSWLIETLMKYYVAAPQHRQLARSRSGGSTDNAQRLWNLSNHSHVGSHSCGSPSTCSKRIRHSPVQGASIRNP